MMHYSTKGILSADVQKKHFGVTTSLIFVPCFLFFDENAVNALNPAAWQHSFMLALSKANKLITVSAFLLANTGSMEKCYRALAISCADSPVLCTQVKMESGCISMVHLPVLMRCSDGILLLLVQKLVDPGSV